MEYIIAICLVVVIVQLSQLVRNTSNIYNITAVLNNNLRIILSGFRLRLKDNKDREMYDQLASEIARETEAFTKLIK